MTQNCDVSLCCALVLERLQNFLPQMAEANQKLKEQMEEAPAGHFDIERVDEAQRVIEMVGGACLISSDVMSHLVSPGLLLCQDVALVELSGSESDFGREEESSTSEDESDSDEENLRLPRDRGKKQKANIQVVTEQAEP